MSYKIREDSWTAEDDGLLINTVLDFVSDGKTQLMAFEEVADMLERTPAAVGFRFNNSLRHKHRDDLAKAKRIRQQNRKKKVVTPVVEVVKEEPKVELVFEQKAEVEIPVRTVKDLIPKDDFPTSDLSIYDSVSDILKKFGAMEKEIRELKKENSELKGRSIK